MNIMHIVYAKVWGGAEQYVYNICKEHRRLGHHNVVAAAILQPGTAGKFQDVAATTSLRLHGIKKFFAFKPFLQLIDTHHIEIINCHSSTMAPLCIVLKHLRPQVKIVMYRHNVTPNRKDWYHHYLQHKTDAFICVSKLVYDLQCKTAYEPYKHKFHLIYNGIDTTRFRFSAHRPQQPVKIGYAGRMEPNKGVLILLQAVKILRCQYRLSCEVYIAGQENPAFQHKCRDFIAANGLEPYCHFIQFIQDIATFYEQIDILVLPSLVKESFGLVLCEAMYSGLPVISTDNGAQREIIEHGVNGLLVPPNDAESLAKQIAALATDANLYQHLAQAGNQRVKEHFTLEQTAHKLNELYRTLTR